MDGPPTSGSRRQFLKGAVVLAGAAGLVGAGVWRFGDGPEEVAPEAATRAQPWLDALAEDVVSGGPGKDGIPAIDEPQFVAADEIDLLTDDDPVFGLTYGGVVRAYPQLVLVWHEIVNDRIGDERLSVTYCPLTGSAFGVRGATADEPLTFGTTGQLVNSNLLMYDRQTDSEWPQLAGVAITGELRGQRLSTVPMTWTTWGRWRRAHPQTEVLSTDTGHVRDYGRDPYGSYTPPAGYYTDDGLFFPVSKRSDRFDPKQVVVAVRAGSRTAAVAKDDIEQQGQVELTVDDTPLAAVWDDRLATARVERRDGGRAADVTYFDVMWFAWYAFHPETEVVG